MKFKEYFDETNILNNLLQMNPVQQVKMDIALNINGTKDFPHHSGLLINDAKWKKQLIPVFQGKERNPQLIQTLIKVVERAIQSHQNQSIGSFIWNKTWIQVYQQWLGILNNALGETNGT